MVFSIQSYDLMHSFTSTDSVTTMSQKTENLILKARLSDEYPSIGRESTFSLNLHYDCWSEASLDLKYFSGNSSLVLWY